MISSICVVVAYFFMVFINHNVNGFISNKPTLQVTSKPFKFGYMEGNFLKMDLSFKLPPDVTAGYVTLRYSPTDSHYEGKFEIRRPKDETCDPVAEVRGFTLSEHVYIDVHLYNRTGVQILNKKICEGVALKSVLNPNYLDNTYTHSLSCLHGQKCDVEADLRKQTEGEELRKKTEKGKDADIKETTLISSFNHIKENETVSSFDSTKQTETINKYMIIIICLSVFAIAMLLLAIASFTKSCWLKSNTPEILQVPIQKINPYYANLLFRKECQEIIDDLEQNQYELLDPFERR